MRRIKIFVSMKSIVYLFSFVAIATFQLFSQTKIKTTNDTLSPPVQITSQQDHQRMLGLLHIDSLRNGPSGNPNAPNAANSDESKANPYPDLPDPLILNNGKKVTSAETWWRKRRPEIKEYFDREIYGRIPQPVPKVRWEILSIRKDTVKNIPVINKELLGHVDNSSYPLISLILS